MQTLTAMGFDSMATMPAEGMDVHGCESPTAHNHCTNQSDVSACSLHGNHQAVSMAKGSCTRHLKRIRADNLNWTFMLSAKRGLLCKSSSTGLTSKSSFLRAARSLWREDRASQLPHGYSLTGQNLQSPYASGQPHFPPCAIWTQR